jgi:hypothetical protein
MTRSGSSLTRVTATGCGVEEMMTARSRVRRDFKPLFREDEFLAHAEIEIDGAGRVVVYVDGDPLFTFVSAEEFLVRYGLSVLDLEPASGLA